MKAAALLLTIFVLSFPQVTYANTSDVSEQKAMRKDAMATDKAALQEKKQGIKENIQEKKTAFKEKIKALKDERKKAVAEQLDTRLATINKNRTDRMSATITRLTTILNTLKTKKEEEKGEYGDVPGVEAAITSAETALTTAQTAVTAQAGKDYTATVTDDSTLRQNFGTEVSQLRTDLAATHKTVVDAKQAVRAVVTELRKLDGKEKGEIPPSSVPVPSH